MVLIRFVFFGTAGAVLGWLIAEPWTNNHGFWRDFALIFCVCLGLVMAMCLERFIVLLRFKHILTTLLNKWIYIALLCGTLAIKLYFLYAIPPEPDIQGQDTTIERRYLVLDVSGSMSFGFFHWKPITQLKKAIDAYLTNQVKIASEDPVGCIVFSSQAKEIKEPSTDYAATNQLVRGLSAGGGTNMTAGLRMARERLDQARDGLPREILLVSDGEPHDPASVLREVRLMDGVTIETIGVGGGYNEPLLREIAALTGGSFHSADNSTELTGIFRQIQGQSLTQNKQSGAKGISLGNRILGWGLFGLLIGLTVTLFKQTQGMFPGGMGSLDAIFIGAFGGVIGGVLGALGFAAISGFNLDGPTSRGVGFTILGLCFGLSIYFVEMLFTKLKGRGV